MADVVVERAVYKLEGDASSFQRALKDAEIATKSFNDEINKTEKENKKTEVSAEKLYATIKKWHGVADRASEKITGLASTLGEDKLGKAVKETDDRFFGFGSNLLKTTDTLKEKGKELFQNWEKGLAVVTSGWKSLTAAASGLSIGGWALAIAGAGVAVAGITYGIIEGTKAFKEYDKTIEAINELMSGIEKEGTKIASKFDSVTTSTIEAANATITFASREGMLNDQMEKNQKQLDKLNAGLEFNREELERAKSVMSQSGQESWVARSWLGTYLGIGTTSKGEERVRSLEALIKAGETAIAGIEGASERVQAALDFDPYTKAAKDMNLSLQAQALTFGKTANQAKIYLMQLRGVDEKILSAARGWDNFIEGAKRFHDVDTAIKNLNKGLEQNVKTWGMSATEIALWRLQADAAEKGITINDEKLGRLRHQADLLNMMNETVKANAEAKEITYRFDPLTRFTDEAERVTRLFEDGRVSADIYQKAMEDVQKRYDAVADSANDARQSIMGIQATLFGSADHLARLQNQILGFQQRGGPFADMAKRVKDRVAEDVGGADWTGAEGGREFESLPVEKKIGRRAKEIWEEWKKRWGGEPQFDAEESIRKRAEEMQAAWEAKWGGNPVIAGGGAEFVGPSYPSDIRMEREVGEIANQFHAEGDGEISSTRAIVNALTIGFNAVIKAIKDNPSVEIEEADFDEFDD